LRFLNRSKNVPFVPRRIDGAFFVIIKGKEVIFLKRKTETNDLLRQPDRIFPDFSVGTDGRLKEDCPLSHVLRENREMMLRSFSGDGTFICRDLATEFRQCFAVYFDGLVNNTVVYESVIRPLLDLKECTLSPEQVAERVIVNVDASIASTAKECFDAMFSGDCVLFLDGYSRAIVASTKGFPVRTPEEPAAEKALLGPREGFTESVLMNVAMVHRKLKTVDFCAETMTFGTRSNTKAFLCYLKSVVRPEILQTVKDRLAKIDMDGVLDSNYIAEQISDSPRSLFRTVGVTERPDVVAAGLLEGRVALIVDGTPVALEMPYVFLETFQTAEDYYQNFWFASIGRLLRILCFLLTVAVPGVFVSLVCYHQELLPTDLALSISAARVGVPFPIGVECFLMITVFEILREASQRLPGNVAQALSIVGAIVIGDAAVSARFIGSTTLIVVAFSGITGLMSPRLKNAVIVIRLVLLLAGSLLGLYGVLFSVLFITFYLMSVKSFRVPYLSYLFSFRKEDQKDAWIRAPWWTMDTRPSKIASDKVRKGDGK